MTNFQPFDCLECGGRVTLRPRPERTWEYRRGVHLQLPADLAVPSCRTCGEVYFDANIEAEIEAALSPTYPRCHVKPHA